MTERKSKEEHTGLERFAHLEDRIYRLVEVCKAVRKENDNLRAENKKLRAELEALHKNGSLAHSRKERDELRERVEKALSLLG